MTGYANGPSLSPGVGPHLQDRAARLDPSDRARDIFPLPCPPKVCQDHYLSRRSQQRFCRKARVLDDSREAVKALNWMNGFSPTDEFDFQPDDMQKEVVGRIMHLTKLAWEPGTLPIVPGCEAALKELLKGRSEYEDPALPVTLARFELERISMPETLDDVPEVADLLPEEARRTSKLTWKPEALVKKSLDELGPGFDDRGYWRSFAEEEGFRLERSRFKKAASTAARDHVTLLVFARGDFYTSTSTTSNLIRG